MLDLDNPRIKDKQGLIWVRQARNLPQVKNNILPNSCNRPWYGMNLDKQGLVYICHCDGWLPYPVGHILDFDSIDEIYNSPIAKKIQQTIIDGTYEFCDTEHCPVVSNKEICVTDGSTYRIEVGIDESCNLSCPSCRKESIFHDVNETYHEMLLWVNRLKQWISKSPNKKFDIYIGGNGEPFASPIYLNLLYNEFEYNNISYYIRTNGNLAQRHISELQILPKLKRIEISIDAASKEIYEKVRKPGRWKNLQENVDYLIDMKKIYNFHMVGNFVIQKTNLNDILPFIDWCAERHIEPCFTVLENWASFDNFDQECVHRSTDPLFPDFIDIIKSQKFRSIKTDWLKNYVNFLK
jgi:MoaA/NifB/PqqE/SkfB family radical SAM enzyme